MYLLDEIKAQYASHQRSALVLLKAQNWIEQNQHRFSHIPTASVINFGDYVRIDFDHMSHQQVMQIVMAFGRPWKREANGDRINYIHEPNEYIRVCCYRGEPPPNCRVEYEEVEIPAQPARTERRAKIVCQPVNTALTNGETPLLQ